MHIRPPLLLRHTSSGRACRLNAYDGSQLVVTVVDVGYIYIYKRPVRICMLKTRVNYFCPPFLGGKPHGKYRRQQAKECVSSSQKTEFYKIICFIKSLLWTANARLSHQKNENGKWYFKTLVRKV